MSAAAKLWNELTDDEQTNWDTVAAQANQKTKNDSSYKRTGRDMFLAWHTSVFLISGINSSFLTNPVFVIADVPSIALTLTRAGAVLTLAQTFNPANGDLLISYFMSAPLLRRNNNSATRFIRGNTTLSTSPDIASQYENAWSTLPVAGEIVLVEYKLLGIASRLPIVYSRTFVFIVVT
jgi:hypothetical protein